MASAPIILLGGFLGAGKTTLLRAAALHLQGRGTPVGLITNDQAPELVDSAILAATGAPVREVAGSCFCCNFGAFLEAATSLAALAEGSVILAEPVGSCTDLAATIIQPLKRYHADRFRPAPLTALVDRERLESLATGTSGLDEDAAYIIRTQLAEADLIAVSKADQLDAAARMSIRNQLAGLMPGRPVTFLSARSGEGVGEWLAWALESNDGGRRLADVDYDRYARGEAVLGWLNAVVRMRSAASAAGGRRPNWAHQAASLLSEVQRDCRERGAAIGHVKTSTTSEGGAVRASVVSIAHPPQTSTEGQPVGDAATVTINARVQTSPEELEAMVRRALERSDVEHEVIAMHTLVPGRPVPTFRESDAS